MQYASLLWEQLAAYKADRVDKCCWGTVLGLYDLELDLKNQQQVFPSLI